MTKRVITGAGYFVVIAALAALKWIFPDYGSVGFDVLFTAVAILGAFEYLRATGVKSSQRGMTYLYCAIIVPVYAVSEYLSLAGVTEGAGFSLNCTLLVTGICLFGAAATFVFDFRNVDLHSTGMMFLGMLYCGVLPLMLSCVNHLSENSLFAVVFLFVLAMFTDSGAFLTGSALHRRFPAKMTPVLSPNKTIVGGIGGIVGGIVAGVACYYLIGVLGGQFVYDASFPGIAAMVIVSALLACVVQIGDLFESAIKRCCGVKDMGKLLPGHGGILDRFDSVLFTAPAVFLAFLLIAAL